MEGAQRWAKCSLAEQLAPRTQKYSSGAAHFLQLPPMVDPLFTAEEHSGRQHRQLYGECHHRDCLRRWYGMW